MNTKIEAEHVYYRYIVILVFTFLYKIKLITKVLQDLSIDEWAIKISLIKTWIKIWKSSRFIITTFIKQLRYSSLKIVCIINTYWRITFIENEIKLPVYIICVLYNRKKLDLFSNNGNNDFTAIVTDIGHFLAFFPPLYGGRVHNLPHGLKRPSMSERARFRSFLERL